jgi:hypothetical protein
LEDYIGQGRLNAVIVAACQTMVLQSAPGGRDKAKVSFFFPFTFSKRQPFFIYSHSNATTNICKHQYCKCVSPRFVHTVSPPTPLSPHRFSSKVVSKSDFLAFSLPHLDGNYFLRPDRILGVFIIDPDNQPRIGAKGIISY